ncbi:MAG TPA: hypothetical protein EYP11_01185, partial [Aquificaceae bacterium]|nr:hypothetical protein [Aquificaceae bacterium]
MRYFKFPLLALLSLCALLPNLGTFSLYMEESRRTLVAFEMANSGNLFQPTVLGEPYFNKPPLFNWTIILSSLFLGWDTLTPRAVTLLSLLLTYVLVVWFSYRTTRNPEVSLLAGLIFLTFSDVLFWYGWLAEIDMTMTLLVFSLFISFFLYSHGGRAHIYTASFISALIFLLKGFPGTVFFILTSFSLFLYKRSIKLFINPHYLIASLLTVALPIGVLYLSQDPTSFLKTLWEESFRRVETSLGPSEFLKHLLSYPILNLKQTLPCSALIIFFLIKGKLNLRSLSKEPAMAFLSLTVLVNYLPYLLSAGSRGRYVLPLFPAVAILIAYLFHSSGLMRRVERLIVVMVVIVAFTRFLYGALFLPYLEEKRGNPQRVAEEIYRVVGGDGVACECEEVRTLCLYLGFLREAPVLKRPYTGEVSYLITCEESKEGSPVGEFIVEKRRLF